MPAGSVSVQVAEIVGMRSLVRFRKTDIDAWLDKRTTPGRMTTAKKISEEIVEDILNSPRWGTAPRAKT